MLLHPRLGYEYVITSPLALGSGCFSVWALLDHWLLGSPKVKCSLKSKKPKASCYELSSLCLLGASGFWTFQKLAVQELKKTGPYLPRHLERGQSSGGKGPQNLA